MNSDPDRGLVCEAQAGNKVSFGKLVDRYYQMVYTLALGVLNHSQDARDVAQEVFLKVFKEIKRFEGKSKFKTWLYRVSVNAAIDYGRKKRPAESIDLLVENEEGQGSSAVVADKQRGPRERASESETAQLLEEALQRLSPEHRAVLVLREYEGLSYEEIADVLKIDLGTVMSRLFYARKKLARHLQGAFEGRKDYG